MRKSYWVAGVLLTGAVAWIVSGQFSNHAPAGETGKIVESQPAATAAKLPKVQVKTLSATPYEPSLSLYGRTQAVRSVMLRSETQGSVGEILAEKGQIVQEGQPILRLAKDDRTAKLRQTKALLNQRQIEYNAAAKLSEKGYRSSTAVAQTRAQLEEARAAVASMEMEMADTEVPAPFDGVLELRLVEQGDFLNVGSEIGMIVDLDPLLTVGDAAEQDVAKIKTGMTAKVALATGQTVEGKVRYVASVADNETRTFRVEVEIPNPQHQLPVGVSAKIGLPLPSTMAHRVSPAVLTLSERGEVGVKIVDQGKVKFIPVAILADDGGGTWLTGLPASIQLITVGQDFVRDGEAVEAIEESTAAQ